MIYLVTNQTRIDSEEIKKVTFEYAYEYLSNKEVLGFDTETTGFDCHTSKVLTVQLGDNDNQFVFDMEYVKWSDLKPLFDKLLIGHNLVFDLRFLYKQGIYPQNVFDTYLAESILNTGIKRPPGYKALDSVCLRRTGYKLNKAIRGVIHKEYLSNRVVVYAAEDVAYLEKIKDSQELDLSKEQLYKVAQLENEFVKVLAYIEYSGIGFDRDLWEEKCKKDDKILEDALNDLNNFVLNEPKLAKFLDFTLFGVDCRINWASPNQVIPIFKTLGINVSLVEDGENKESIGFDNIALQNHPLIPIYLRYRGVLKDVTSFGRNFYKHINPKTNRIHTKFNQILDTGRISCGGKNKNTKESYINLQQIPSKSDTRRCFIPKVGNKFIVSDYASQETRVLAELCKDEVYSKYVSDPTKDLHCLVASLVYPEISHLTHAEIKKQHKDKRNFVKPGTFVIPYGGTGFTISQNLGLSIEVGERVYNGVMREFPGLKNYFNYITRLVKQLGYVPINTVSGRKSYVDFFDEFKMLRNNYDDLDSENKKRYSKLKGIIDRKALNYRIQGTSADMSKLAGIYLFRFIINNNKQDLWLMPNIVHDELQLDLPEEDAELGKQVIKESMENAGKRFCQTIPIVAEPEICDWWAK